jgi:hypothetical protein
MRNAMIWMTVVALVVVIGGCAHTQKEAATPVKAKEAAMAANGSAELALKYAVGQTGNYKVISESWRTAKFEGPELSKEPKLKSGRTGGAMEMVCSQEVTNVNPDGSAVAKVTVKAFKYKSESSSEVTNDFDSAKDADKTKPFAKLIGQSYMIKLTPDGKADVVDAAAIRGAITEGSAKDVVAALFSDKEIARLHTITALPTEPKQKVGGTWSVTELSPKGMMDSKNFEKVYTFKEIKDGSDIVEMKAVPSTKPAEKGEVNNQAMMMSMFSNMMESKNDFTGKLVLGADGTLKSYNETLNAQWFATDPQAKPDKEPDKITMGFVQKHAIKKVN